LVVMLHGGFGNGAQAERAYHWDTQADNGHFVVAYPDGLNRAWNAGTCCGNSQHANVDDVGFLTAMVGGIAQQVQIDPARVYATGMSNGAMMALRLGCQTDVFAAIAPVAGTLLTDCSRAKPTSVLQIHGTADDRVPYDGGPGKAFAINGNPRVDGPSVPSVNATWQAIDACGPPTSTTAGDVTTQTAACADGRAVELISVAGAGHQWPGGAPSPVLERFGIPAPSTALDATDTVWQFFTQHHR
jgi:polyhydroxybutyrate depolymerase